MSSISFRRPVHLDRDRVWAGLLHKAADPTSYISAITGCTVLEREPGALVREIVVNGSIRHRERAVFHAPDRIVFHQLTDSSLDTIVNTIEEEDGVLYLRLTITGTPGRLAEMHDYFAHTLEEIVTALHAGAGAPT
ncbi:AtaL-like protein [Hamadaea sp. NPDC051192]|uniref:AtaL-like protein n=1 Tax=Hamadaea sp. NPDC051192 TaxID=3154940 RepID=UPI00342F4C26